MRLLSVFYFSFEISIACWLVSRPNLRIVSKLTTDVVTYRYYTEASNQKSKYAYRKIFFYKKSTGTEKKKKIRFSQPQDSARRHWFQTITKPSRGVSASAASLLTAPTYIGMARLSLLGGWLHTKVLTHTRTNGDRRIRNISSSSSSSSSSTYILTWHKQNNTF